VTWLEEYVLYVGEKEGITTKEKALEYAKDNLNSGENIECHSFNVTENLNSGELPRRE